jgi:membrane protease YdiL (CAAX protease family)
MIGFQQLIKKYQLHLFFLLAYLLSWWSLLPVRGLLSQGVALAAVIVILLSAGKPGLREFWKRLINFRAGWLLFLAAPVIIIGFKLFDIASNLLAGGTFAGFPRVPFVIIAIELLLLGGLWEEIGWSGYALPVLQKRFAKFKYGILFATLIVGIFRGIWHLPLLIVGAIPWYDAVWFTPFVFQPFISWLYNKSGGSVLVVMFFHYMSNLLFAASPSFTGADKTLYTILYMTCGGLATLVLVWKTRFKLGLRKDSL